MDDPYEGDDVVETRDRVRRIETRLTNLIKHMGFAPTDWAKVKTDELVAVTSSGQLVASSAAVTLGDVFFAAQKHHLRGMVDVYVGNRYFGKLLTTRE
jgi:hypothetical protein